MPSFLEKAVALLDQHPRTGVVGCWVRTFGARSGIWKPTGGAADSFLMRSNAPASALFRRRCWEEVGGYDEKLSGYESKDFYLGITEHGWIVEILPEPLFFKRAIKNSMVDRSNHNRRALMTQIIANHRALYERHVDTLFMQMDEQLRTLAQRSLTYEIGRALWQPLKRLLPTRMLQRLYEVIHSRDRQHPTSSAQRPEADR